MNNNPIFDEFKKGEATNKIFNGVYSGQIFEADELNGINVEDIKTAVNLNNRPIFIDGVVARLNDLGVDCKTEDTDIILEEVKHRYKERIGEVCPRNGLWS